ncbi:DinB family protein [Gottfriedia acidiceleris]|uniref:DinB family protein n=1 Tax=Gottfriedia acidiceleris TaxID=371036 RepID=UPI000B43567A|nr:DinB family protein [Gottfriedia acidiceleris]
MVDAIFEQLRFTRVYTLKVLSSVSKEVVDVIPAGFNNNILWNAGHVLGAYEQLLYANTGDTGQLSKEFIDFFKGGTNPGDWQVEPPSYEEIVSLLEQQVEQVITTYEGRLDEIIPKEMKLGSFEIKTVRDMISFNIFHEGLHTGLINGLKRSLGQ